MTSTARSLLALTFAGALAGCFGDHGNKDPGKDNGKANPAADSQHGSLTVGGPLKALEGLKVVVPAERKTDEGTVIAVGRIEMTMPSGWAAMRLGGQTKYLNPETGENLTIVGYTASAPLEPERQRDVIVALTELSTKAEKVLGVFGAKVKLSPPLAGPTPWGQTSTFSAIGPLNRVAFHYSAVGKGEALLLQIDGNTEAGTPEQAIALIKSVRYAPEAAPEKAPPAPPPKK